jgi:hypothetical protein
MEEPQLGSKPWSRRDEKNLNNPRLHGEGFIAGGLKPTESKTELMCDASEKSGSWTYSISPILFA